MNKPWQPLGIPSAITPIGQLHQSPPSPIPGILGRGPSHQSHVLEHRDTYGQVQVCSKGRQGISVDRPCQPSFCQIKFWHVRNLLPQSIRLRLSVLVRYCAGQGEWSDFVVERALFHKYGVGRDISQPWGSVYPFDLPYLHRPHDSGPPLSLSE